MLHRISPGIFLPIVFLIILCGCDSWSVTTLKNDLPDPVPIQLYFSSGPTETDTAEIIRRETSSQFIQVMRTPFGMLPTCKSPTIQVSGSKMKNLFDEDMLQKWTEESICVEKLSDAGACVVYMTLAPNEELALARVLGPIAGHPLDSLSFRWKTKNYNLASNGEINQVISRTGFSSFQLKLKQAIKATR